MAFGQQATITPQGIGDLTVELLSPDPTSGNASSARFTLFVRMSDGTNKQLSGDLVPHLTPAQINSLLAFMALLRTKAEDEILP